MVSPGNQHCASCIGTLSFPIVMSVSVCPSASISENACPNFHLHFLPVTHDGGSIGASVLLWRRCGCTSGFVDGVIFALVDHMEARWYRCGEWRHRVVVHKLTPLLRGIGCVVSKTTAGARPDESIVQRVPGAEHAMRHCLATDGIRLMRVRIVLRGVTGRCSSAV